MSEKSNLSGIEMLQKLKQKALNEKKDNEVNKSMVKKNSGIVENDRQTDVMPDLGAKQRQTETMPDLGAKQRQTETMPDLGAKQRQTETMPEIDSDKIQKENSNSVTSPSGVNGFELTNFEGTRHYKQDGKRIGHGGTADIYRVICQEDQRKYIAKIYQEDRVNNHIDEFYEQFKGMSLKGLINILDRGAWNIMDSTRKFYILPDYSNMMNLRQYIEQYDVSDAQLIRFIKEMNEALHTLHSKGFFHRDIKPENILCDKMMEKIILLDYGSITKGDLEVCDTKVTRNVNRTEGYTAPEIYLWFSLSDGKEVQANEKTDYFALGAVLGDIFKSMDSGNEDKDSHLFRDDKAACFASQTNDFPFPTNLTENGRMLNLVHALLLYEPKNRAGYKDVLSWLDGKELYIDQKNYSKAGRFEYTFKTVKYNSPETLARVFAENWDGALTEVNRGELLNRLRAMSDDYKEYADNIADIEDFYQLVEKKEVRDDSMLLEIISVLGTNLPFMWKGKIYETDDGNTDIDAVISDLYEEAINGGNNFDSLLCARSIKELLYPEIRFVDDTSSMHVKEETDFESKMLSVSAINNMAKESMDLAKFYVVEKCKPGFLVNQLSGGKTQSTNEYLREVFTAENLDDAMKNLYDGNLNVDNPIIKFLSNYIKQDEIRAMLMASYELRTVPTIEPETEKVNALLEMYELLLKIQCQQGKTKNKQKIMSVDIAATFLDSCLTRAVLGYAEAVQTWEFKDFMGSKAAQDRKRMLEKNTKLLLDVKRELEEKNDKPTILTKERNEEKDDMIKIMGKFIAQLEAVKKLFVSDETLLGSGLVLATSKDNNQKKIFSSVYAKDKNNSLCLVNKKYWVPRKIAEEVYAPLGNKISNPKPQNNFRRLSIEACNEQVQKFYNNFKKIAGVGIEDIIKYKKGNLVWDFIVALFVVLLGIGVFFSGILIIAGDVYQTDIMNKTYAIGIIIADFVLGAVFVLGCWSDLQAAKYNLNLYKKNQDLLKRINVINRTRSALNLMESKKQLDKLDKDQTEVVQMSCSLGDCVKNYFNKYKLYPESSNYITSRTGALFFAVVIGIFVLLYNHIPARNVLGAMLADKITVASEYVADGETLPPVLQPFNKILSKFALVITEGNAKSALIDKYNDKHLTQKEYIEEKNTYLKMCESVGYFVEDSFRDALDKLVLSKQSFVKGKELNEKGKMKAAISQFNNVIKEDSDYFEAQQYLSSYVDGLYKQQQAYIEKEDKKKLKKLVKEYKKLLNGNINDSALSDVYRIILDNPDLNEMSRKLVAYQMYRNKEEWDDDDISRISCVKSSDRGKYYVRVEKENSGITWLLHRYVAYEYVFFTYGWSSEANIPDKVEFNMQEFEPDSGQNDYLGLLG